MPPKEKTAADVDYEKIRDEKVVPVAKSVLNDIAVMLIPQSLAELDYKPLVLKILERTLEVNMNIATETSYLFQLLLTALSGLNATVQSCTTTPIDDARYGAIAKKILDILAMADLKLNLPLESEEMKKSFDPIKEQLNTLFAAEKLSMLEINYIMGVIFNSFKIVNNMYTDSITKSSEAAEAKLFGVQSMTDLTVGDIDKILKAKKE